jgi:hypothetical protein
MKKTGIPELVSEFGTKYKIMVRSSIVCGLMILSSSGEILAQSTPRKVTFTGAARGYFMGDNLNQNTAVEDTTTIPRLHSGHVMTDLGTHIRPNSNMEIIGMVRVRNDYGGFWGSGVTFDVRQMSVRGVIGGVVRYQLGDINYRMSRLTMWNEDQEFYKGFSPALRQQMDVINYDHFYNFDNAWRQQGGSAEWGLVFKRFIKEMQFQTMTTRNRTTDFGGTNERLFSGVSAQVVQSKYLRLGFNYVDLYDVAGTSRNKELFHNPVWTTNMAIQYDKNNWKTKAEAEWGKSRTEIRKSTVAPLISGEALDAKLEVQNTKYGVTLYAAGRRITSGFLSPGAQTKRINFNAQSEAYQRIGNEQNLRDFTVMDIMRESAFYTMQLRPYLMDFAPKYDNITPYGTATPNRQGFVVGASWKNKKETVHVRADQTMLQEIRGEGTLNARQFSRTDVKVRWHNDKKVLDSRKWAVEGSVRLDQTTRQGTEYYRGVDLTTQTAGLGLEYEVFNKLDVLAGWQLIEYTGFDFVAVRDQYAQIVYFNEYDVHGRESITAAGLRYRFSDKSFLTAQVNMFDMNNGKTVDRDYDIRQVMVLYSITF